MADLAMPSEPPGNSPGDRARVALGQAYVDRARQLLGEVRGLDYEHASRGDLAYNIGRLTASLDNLLQVLEGGRP